MFYSFSRRCARMLPRFIRLRYAPDYLGMDKIRFNREVRVYLTEIPIGRQGIAFDRLEMESWRSRIRAAVGVRLSIEEHSYVKANPGPLQERHPGHLAH
jgi:hypothetical protein